MEDSSPVQRWLPWVLAALALAGGFLVWLNRDRGRAMSDAPATGAGEVATGAAEAASPATAGSLAAADTGEAVAAPVAGTAGTPARSAAMDPQGSVTPRPVSVTPQPVSTTPRASATPTPRASATPVPSPDVAASSSTRASSQTARREPPPATPPPRPLEMPAIEEREPPPPPGQARLRTGSIPVERVLTLDGERISSFTLNRQVFAPGRHRIRLEASRGCVEFTVDLRADEIVYLIWDFELNGWRRHVRVGRERSVPVSPPVSPCKEVQ